MSPSVIEYIYKELAFDGSQTTNPVMQERLRLISLGHTDLIADLRHTNPGRPNTKFDVFFEKLQEVLENITAADDRRHGHAHLSKFISISDMIQRAVSTCPPGTPVPSASLVKLQFAPRNPYCQGALNFTSRLNVQFKIQRRQLRTTHPDSHFCNAQFKYLKSFAVEEAERCMMVCCDDKAKVPIGDPGASVSTGVRGKKSIVPTSSTLIALDHDMTRCSLTPSVVLQCEVPKSVDKSFVRGKVFIVLNDSIFQTASPFRHAAFLSKMMLSSGNDPKPMLLKFTDGGVDQRNTLEAVKLANICLFKEFNLDLLIHVRSAPGHSYTNPAERVMSILNLGLQNVSLERKPCEKKIEDALKNKNSMAEVRAFHEENPNFRIRQGWTESLEEVKRTIQNRFIRLKLKDEPVQVLDPLSDQDIEVMKRHLRELFPDMDLTKLQKTHTRKIKSYQDWLDRHCKSTQYVFQIKKCDNVSCCIPPRNPQPSWLPDPQLDATGEHYLPYSEVRGKETTEKDRPTLKLLKKKKPQVPAEEPAEGVDCSTVLTNTCKNVDVLGYIEEPQSKPSLCTVQNARSIVECIECRKPRVVYSKYRLTERQQYSIVCDLSELEYTCGSPILPPSNPLYKPVMARSTITCESPVELSYYRSGLGHADLCSYCCGEGEVNQELLQKFKTVLLICESCILLGKDIITQRPYGKC